MDFKTVKYATNVILATTNLFLMMACHSGSQTQQTDLESRLTVKNSPSVPIRNCEQFIDPKSRPSSNPELCRIVIKRNKSLHE